MTKQKTNNNNGTTKAKARAKTPSMPSLALAPTDAPRTRRDARRLGAMERQRRLVEAYHALLTSLATGQANTNPQGLPRDMYDHRFVGLNDEARVALVETKMRAAAANVHGIAGNYNKAASGKRSNVRGQELGAA